MREGTEEEESSAGLQKDPSPPPENEMPHPKGNSGALVNRDRQSHSHNKFIVLASLQSSCGLGGTLIPLV